MIDLNDLKRIVLENAEKRQKQDEEFRKFTEEFEKEVEREKARIMGNLDIQLGAIK